MDTDILKMVEDDKDKHMTNATSKKDLKKWLDKSSHLASLPTVPQVVRQIRKACL